MVLGARICHSTPAGPRCSHDADRVAGVVSRNSRYRMPRQEGKQHSMRRQLGPCGGRVFAVTVAVAAGPRAIARRPSRSRRRRRGRSTCCMLSVDQVRRSMRISVHTSGSFYLGALNRHPDTNKSPPTASSACRSTSQSTTSCASSASVKGPNGATTRSATRAEAGQVGPEVGRDRREGEAVERPLRRRDGSSPVPRICSGPLSMAGRQPVDRQEVPRPQWSQREARPCFDRLPNGHDALSRCIACSRRLQGFGRILARLRGPGQPQADRADLRRRAKPLHAPGALDPQAPPCEGDVLRDR